MTTTERLDELRAYLERLASDATSRARSAPKLTCELPSGSEGHYYVIATVPAHEDIAAEELIKRGFGTYLPIYEQEFIRGRVKKTKVCVLFRGYVFAYVWDIARNKHRIETCDGVSHILKFAGTERFAVVPDEAIKEIEVLELNYFFNGPNWVRPRRKKRNSAGLHDPVKVSPKSYFSGIEGIDGRERNGLLHRALGLAS